MKIGVWKMRSGLLARVEKHEEGTEWPWKGCNEKGDYLSWAEDGSRVGSTSVPYDDDSCEPNDEVYIVEGVFDAIMMIKSGYNAIAIAAACPTALQ